jgi:hypothetical protein
VVHVEEVKKVQHFVKANPVSLDILRTGGILHDQCANDGKECKENEERNGEFEGPEKVIEDREKSTFLGID